MLAEKLSNDGVVMLSYWGHPVSLVNTSLRRMYQVNYISTKNILR